MAESAKMKITVGSRKSQLALIQTNIVIDDMKRRWPHLELELVTMTTTGDNIVDKALSKIGEKSLFTKELELALEAKTVDFVVHSLKDIPTILPPGMVIAGVLKREEPNDAVVLHPNFRKDSHSLASLPSKSIIGTSSVRRTAQLRRRFPHLKFQDIRGNLNTRLNKLENHNVYAALILASAGLKRMGWIDKISETLKPEECLYAVGQGALAIECRSDDSKIIKLVSQLHDFDTVICCIAERSFLNYVEGGCSIPVAVATSIKNNMLKLQGGIYSLDGSRCVEDEVEINLPEVQQIMQDGISTKHFSGIIAPYFCADALQVAENCGIELAKQLINNGALEILNEFKNKK